ncbi:MAG: uracil-DNA glycosylase [Epsilonproteobacteria bacterium]|nr:uracil-DNA glycosylase [Campylobacterota bacterium]
MNNLLKLKHLYNLKFLNEEYFEGFEIQNEIQIPNDYEELKQLVSNCRLCPLSHQRTNVVFGEGNLKAQLMLIGEAPGREEDLQGRPFVGRSGEMLTKMLKNVLALDRSEVYIANIIKCRPPFNRDPNMEEIENCKHYLIKQIEIIQPKLIVTLGRVAFSALLNDTTPITKARGKVYSFMGIKVIPTFHPSYLLRNPSKKRDALEDLNFIKRFL